MKLSYYMPFSFFHNNPQLRRTVEFSIKLVILLLLFASLYWQIARKDDIGLVFSGIMSAIDKNIYLILLVVGLMFANWGIEALKWWLLINRAEPLTYFKSFLAIFSGATLTLFTPNRIGEYGGRFIFLKRPLRLETLQATILGSIAQIWVTILAGMAGLVWWLSGTSTYTGATIQLMYWGLGFAMLFFTLLYFRLDIVARLIGKIKVLKRYQDKWTRLIHFSNTELLKVLILAAIRYGIYTGQFLILLYALDVSIDPWHGAALIATIFLLQSSIPTIAIIDLGVRGNLALFVFNGYTEQLNQVVAAAFCLWLINLVLPAILGYGIILSTKLFRS